MDGTFFDMQLMKQNHIIADSFTFPVIFGHFSKSSQNLSVPITYEICFVLRNFGQFWLRMLVLHLKIRKNVSWTHFNPMRLLQTYLKSYSKPEAKSIFWNIFCYVHLNVVIYRAKKRSHMDANHPLMKLTCWAPYKNRSQFCYFYLAYEKQLCRGHTKVHIDLNDLTCQRTFTSIILTTTYHFTSNQYMNNCKNANLPILLCHAVACPGLY